MFLFSLKGDESLLVEHCVGIVAFARQHDDNTLIDCTLFSRTDGFPTSRDMSTVSCHTLPACIAVLKTCLLYHNRIRSKNVVCLKMKQKPRFQAGLLSLLLLSPTSRDDAPLVKVTETSSRELSRTIISGERSRMPPSAFPASRH